MKHLLILVLAFLTLTPKAQTVEDADMVVLINQIRYAPKTFVPYVEAYIQRLETGIDTRKFKTVTVKVQSTAKKSGLTDSLIAEANRLIVYLKNKKSTYTIELAVGLYPITKAHAKYLDSTNQITHDGPNGQTLKDRTKGYTVIENACLTKNGDVADCLVQLLMDYGTKVKTHRDNIFSGKVSQVSVARSGNVWVQDFIYAFK